MNTGILNVFIQGPSIKYIPYTQQKEVVTETINIIKSLSSLLFSGNRLRIGLPTKAMATDNGIVHTRYAYVSPLPNQF
jgi:hypothetical protein